MPKIETSTAFMWLKKNLRLQSGVPDTSKSEQVHAFLFQLPYPMTLNIIMDNNWENDGKTEKVIGNARAKPERMYDNIICI